MKKMLKSFLVTLFILLLVFLVFGIYPFGDKSIIVIDSNTQYVSFISYLKSVFFGLNDFKYLFSSSLGSNFIPLMGYYLMSPLNLLSIFFTLENMKVFMTIIILIKICLCSASMEYYLDKKFGGKGTIIFSICYGLMAYNIAYMYHLMWLDSIILFPLVILGIDYVFNDKSVFLYIITLALSIIFNYYIGFIICIASLIYFIYKFVLDYKDIDRFKVGVNYIVSSFLSGVLSMFILLPSVLGLQGGKASFSFDNLNLGFNSSYLEVFARSFTASLGMGDTWHGGPMIACGMLIVALVIFYFFNKKFSRKEKIVDGLLIFFLSSTFVFSALDLLFHGLTVPNCFDYRHAFVFVFFVIMIAYKNYLKVDIDIKSVKMVGIIFSILLIFICLSKYKFFTTSYNLSLAFSVIMFCLFVYLLYKKKTKYLFAFVLLDLIINVSAGVFMITISDRQFESSYKDYVVSTKEVIDSIKDNSFYRLEKTFDREVNKTMLSINDSMIFDYNGISHFDSTSKLSTEVFLENLGFRRLITRSFYNMKGGTTWADSLLGIKYVLSYDDYKNYDKVLVKNNIGVYENPYFLSLGYVINSDDIVFTDNVFENQNNMAKAFSSLNENIYSPASYEGFVSNIVVNENRYVPSGEGVITYKINIEKNENLYFYVPVNEDVLTNYTDAKLYLNGEYIDDYFTKYNWGVYDLGKFNVGDTIEVKFNITKDLIMDNIYFYYESLDVLSKHHDVLKMNQLNINKISSSYLACDINLDKASKVLLTIPYDEGWSAIVNDKNVDIDKSMDALMTIMLDEGVNKLELKYEPKGLRLGIVVSFVSLLITVIYITCRNLIWDIYYKFKEIFNYIIVGVLTTIVSLVSYFIFSRIMDINITFYFILSNTLSWILSVAFAYVTNKLFVFNSKAKGRDAFREMIKFVSSRVVTYLIDLTLMFILVKAISFNNDVSKLIVQFVVLVLNYVFSKLLVFKSK